MTDRAPLMLGVLWTFQVIAVALVGLRLYARLLVVQTYGWDDHCFNAAVALLFIYNVLLSVAAPLGVGKTSSGALIGSTSANESTALLLVNISQSLVDLMAILVKASIAIFLLRIVASERTHKIAVLAPVVVMSVVVVVALLCLWFSCTPVSYSWDLSIPGGQCNGEEQFVVALVTGLLIVVVEVFYASFPWFLVRKLQMPRKEKILVGSCMSFGYISALCSIYRLLTLLDLAYTSNEDYFYTIVDLLIWHAADITTQLVSVGVTVCRPLYKDWLNNVVEHIDSVTNRSKPDNTRLDNPGLDGAGGGSGGFSVIALQTIGGSSVVPPHGKREKYKKGNDAFGGQGDEEEDGYKTMARSKATKGAKAGVEHAACGVVTVQRSWRVESSSRSVLLRGDGDDAGSEEGILGAHASHCEDGPGPESHEHKV